MKRFWKIMILALALAATLCFGAMAEGEQPVFTLPVGTGRVEVHTEWMNEELWLFLPTFARLEDLTAVDAELEWWDTEPDEENCWYVDVIRDEEYQEVRVMRSENLRTMFLFSDDPVHQGIAFVEDSSTKHENEAPASLVLVDTQGTVQHEEHIEKLRGRGNGTWAPAKRSYQLKLDHNVDLLDTGDRTNRAKKWLLISEVMDETMLHNQISMDLGRELGLEVMESEFIDLYYDGLYRGLYRLSEKVEVGEGRIDILDYDEVLSKWNRKVGQPDLDLLPAAEAQNRFGNAFTYIEGVVDNHIPNSAGYVVEMEYVPGTLSDRCYFKLDRSAETEVYALKNPENASRQAVAYISERLQEAQNTLRAGGINPETGATAEEEFDLDAFARTLMIQELSGNVDGYTYSSSFFVLPEGETRFEPGPLWDLDLAYRLRTDGSTGYALGFKDTKGWLVDFYRVPAFMETARRIYQEELFPLIQEVLFGDRQGRYLKAFDEYVEQIAVAERMNDLRWQNWQKSEYYFAYTPEGEIWQLRSWIDRRSKWLYEAYEYLAAADETHIGMWMTVSFNNPDDGLHFVTVPWENYTVQVISTEQLTEATEDEYARWRMKAIVSSLDERSLEGCTISVNGTLVTPILQDDGSLMICAEYEDESYRPVDYYGQDVGQIYQYERYIDYYPQIGEAFDYDEESIMDYFFDEGIYEGQVGNSFFEPREIAWRYPHLKDYLYDDWSMYYWEYLDWGYEANWVDATYHCFKPSISDAADSLQ